MKCSRFGSTIMLCLFGGLLGCTDALSTPEIAAPAAADETRGVAPGRTSLLEVSAVHRGGEHLFLLSRDEIPSGWTDIQFTNASHADHFILLYRVPEAAMASAVEAGQPLLEHWYETITVPFQEQFDPYITGQIAYGQFVDNLLAELGDAVTWLVPAGGPGMTAAGQTSQVSVHLEPGTYVLECYVKDGDEKFHSYRGMLELLTVTDHQSGAGEPRANARIVVSQPEQGGIQIPDGLRPGMNTFAIEFGEQPTYGYEHLLGHNAHLVRLDDIEDEGLLEELAAWMDWTKPGSLVGRAPAGAEFLGGSMEMRGGSTAYFTVNLRPGGYAWIAEVPDPAGKRMLKVFAVPGAAGADR
jgi:hypothetical protein